MLATGSHVETIHLAALIVVVGTGLQWLASWLRVPALIVLLCGGILLGPVTGLLDPAEISRDEVQPLVSLAVAVVLFEGGLSLRFDEVRMVGPALWRLIIAGLVLCSSLVAVAAIFIAGLSVSTAAVLGAILVVTGPTVILPMLRNARIAARPATLLKWEGIVNDPLGALLAVFVFTVSILEPGDQSGLEALIISLVRGVIASGLIGALVAYGLGKALETDRIPPHLKNPVILAGVFLVFAVSESIREESGLLGVTILGIVLANLKNTHVEDIRHFKEQVSSLLISVLFLLLASRLEPSALQQLLGPPLILVAVIVFLIRPVTVWAGTIGAKLPWRERLLLGWIAPRGVVAAAVAGAFEPRLLDAGHSDAKLLVPIVFGVIFATIVLHGLSIRPFASWLGLAAKEGNGILIVGVRRWTIALAKALENAGVEVVLSDTQYHRVSRGRREGLTVHYGDALDDEESLMLPFERLSWLLAATDDDAYNTIVCMNLAREFGTSSTLQLTPDPRSGPDIHANLRGQMPWGEHGSYSAIAGGFWRAHEVKVTTITASYTWEDFLAKNPDAMPLFQVQNGRIAPIGPDSSPPEGVKVVFVPGVTTAVDPVAS